MTPDPRQRPHAYASQTQTQQSHSVTFTPAGREYPERRSSLAKGTARPGGGGMAERIFEAMGGGDLDGEGGVEVGGGWLWFGRWVRGAWV